MWSYLCFSVQNLTNANTIHFIFCTNKVSRSFRARAGNHTTEKKHLKVSSRQQFHTFWTTRQDHLLLIVAVTTTRRGGLSRKEDDEDQNVRAINSFPRQILCHTILFFSYNSRSRLFPGTIASDSRSLAFPFPKLWNRLFSFPSHSRTSFPFRVNSDRKNLHPASLNWLWSSYCKAKTSN